MGIILTQAAPSFPARRIQFQNILEIFDSLGELFFGSENARNSVHRRNRPLVMSQCLLICVHGAFEVAHQFRQTAYRKIVSHTRYTSSGGIARTRGLSTYRFEARPAH